MTYFASKNILMAAPAPRSAPRAPARTVLESVGESADGEPAVPDAGRTVRRGAGVQGRDLYTLRCYNIF